MSARRVAIFINTLRRGGMERDAAMVCKHMDRSRYEPEIWTLHPGGDYEDIVRAAGVKVHCLERDSSFDPRFAVSAARRIAKIDVDLFHVFLPAIMFYVGLSRLLFRAKPPIIYSEPATMSTHPWLQPMQAWMLRTQCSGFAANSVSSRDFLASQGIQQDRIQIIANGHELDRFRGPLDRSALRATLGLSPQDRFAIFVGRFVDTKRVCDLIEAVRLLGDERGTLRVGLVGDGPERANLEQQVLQAGLSDVVQFMGMREDVPELLRSADLFVFPSETEGLSNAVIEAALAGLPIIGCDIGGVREIFEDGREGRLVGTRDAHSFADAMKTYLQDPELARAHGEAARCRASQEYSIERTLTQIYRLYDQVLGSNA